MLIILKRLTFLAVFFLLLVENIGATNTKNSKPKEEMLKQQQAQKKAKRRIPKYKYGYVDRKHTLKEVYTDLGIIYGVSWAIYPLTQPTVVKNEGSWKKYKKHFGDLVFDKDEPFWNWVIHPISGSQLFLFYRARGYNRIDSVAMSFISSALFEFTVEIYTEPASIQDLYQTPILGAFLGVGLENLSLYLLNTGNAMGRFLGHLINPSTLFPFFEGKVRIVPQWNLKKDGSVTMIMEF